MAASFADYTVTGNTGAIVSFGLITPDGRRQYAQARAGATVRMSVADAASANALSPGLLTFVAFWPG